MTETQTTKPPPAQRPSIGRIVLVNFRNDHGQLVTRPAIIVEVNEGGDVDLSVFANGERDLFGSSLKRPKWFHGVPEASADTINPIVTWSWPPRVG